MILPNRAIRLLWPDYPRAEFVRTAFIRFTFRCNLWSGSIFLFFSLVKPRERTLGQHPILGRFEKFGSDDSKCSQSEMRLHSVFDVSHFPHHVSGDQMFSGVGKAGILLLGLIELCQTQFEGAFVKAVKPSMMSLGACSVQLWALCTLVLSEAWAVDYRPFNFGS